MNAGGRAGSVHFLVGGLRVGILEVVHEGLVEEGGVLGDDSDMAANRVDSEILDILAVEFDAALVTVIVTEHVSEQGRFATTRLANKGRCGSRSALEADVTQGRPSSVIGKAHILPSNMSSKVFEGYSIGRVNDGRLDLEELQKTLARNHGLLDGSIKGAEEVERTLKLGHIGHDNEPVASRSHANQDLPTAEQGSHYSTKVEDESLADVHEDHAILNLGLGLLEDLDLGSIPVGLVLLCVEVFDRLITRDRVVLHRFFFAIGVCHLSSLVCSRRGHLDCHVEVPTGVHQVELSVQGTKVEVEDGD